MKRSMLVSILFIFFGFSFIFATENLPLDNEPTSIHIKDKVQKNMLQDEPPVMAPLNPEFISYFENDKDRSKITVTSEGTIYNLGFIPPRVSYRATIPPNFVPVTLPASYDLRNEGYITSVKNQGNCGSCWAFATFGAVESYWLKDLSETHDLSENNLNYGHGFVNEPCAGGNATMALAYLSRGDGPISEADDPYEGADGSYHSGLSPVAYVFEGRHMPDNDELLKQMIYEHGALYTSMHVADPNSGETFDDYMNDDNTYYYDGTESTNHAVTLAGWDDNKVVEGAPGNGAWIIKNSWGSTWAENGYFYVSYYDTKINSYVSYFPYHKTYRSTQRILQYDKLGKVSACGYSDGSDYALIKFPITENMAIEEIGTYIQTAGSVSMEIYTQFDGSTLSGFADSIGMKSCSYPGFYTFTLADEVSVSNGDNLYIKVNYNTPGYNYPIPIEQVDSSWAIPEIESNIFWISSTGADATWFGLGNGTSYEWDPCVKLYGCATGLSADFTASPTSGDAPLTVNFTDMSSGDISSWSWDFGDGSSSTDQNPQHIYNDHGAYTVALTVSDGINTSTETKNNYISIEAPSDTLLAESFESGATGWTVVDNDGDTKTWMFYSESGSSYDLAHSGDIGVGVEFNSSGNDDWLITPSLSIPSNGSYYFSFWAKSRSNLYLEDFNIKLSTSGASITNFTTELLSVTDVPDTWTQYTAEFNAVAGQTVFIAVQCVSIDDWYLFADDFLCIPHEIEELQYSGGSGSEADPYVIANLEDLQELSTTPGDWNACFIQSADIAATGTESWSSGLGFSPIGNDTISFTGSYNGQEHLISELYIDRPEQNYIGLFGYIAGATVENLTMSDINITGGHRTGGMIGEADSSSMISHCHVSGSVSGERYVGGLNGHNIHSRMINCSSSMEVYGNTSYPEYQYVGGLTGANSNVGYSSDSSIIRQCYSAGSVTGAQIVGGLVGNNSEIGTLVENCYSTADVTGTNTMTGGCIGNSGDNADIRKCYSMGSVTGGSSYTGGFLGRIQTDGTISDCFWDTETSGQSSSAGGTGKTTAEMLDETTYASAAWDFVNIWNLDLRKNAGYPYLKWQSIPEGEPYSGGSGSEADPYVIANLEDLKEMSMMSDEWGAYFIQSADINALATETWNDGLGFSPIGNDTTSFTGNYDAQDHLISGLNINRPEQSYIGLFGYIAGATVENLTMSGIDVTGDERTGGMIGEADNGSTISNCHVSGAISGERYVGGLCGHNLHSLIENSSSMMEVYGNTSYSDDQYVGGLTGANSNTGYTDGTAIIRQCYSGGSVTGAQIVGGLAGNNAETGALIENCYSTASISGSVSMTGGFVGNNTDNAHIQKCYSMGEVNGGSSYTGGFLGRTQTGGTNSDCFWDTETSGQSSSAGGTGKTTAEMLGETTYSSAGWDFSSIWDIDPANNGGYPYLSWQVITGSQSFAFTPAGHIDDGGDAYDIAISADTTIFLANNSDGLRAYTYDGSNFVNTAHVEPGSYVRGIAVDSEGTIFIGNYANGLKAYTYDGSSFTMTASIDDGGDALGIAVADDGTIFLANNDDGIRAYTYNGSSFTNTAHIDDGDMALDLALGADGTIFAANRRNGLRAYTYDGSSFTAAGDIISNPDGSSRHVAVAEDGTIFLANYDDGLRAYTHDGSTFTNTAHIYQASNAKGVAVNDDGVIFLANDTDGLRAYTYDGFSFTNTAHIDDGGNADGVKVGPDGTIFLANGYMGIRAYRYGVHETPAELVLLSGSLSHDYGEISQGNEPETATYQFTISNTGDSLLTGEITEDAEWFNVSPNSFSLTKGSTQVITVTASTSDLSADTYSETINLTSNGGDLSGTVDITIITSIGFELIAEVDDGGSIYGLDVKDGTIYLANDYDGMRAYEFDGSTLDSITQFKYNSSNDEQDVAVGNDGVVYCANGTYGLFAFSYDGSSFGYIADIDDSGTAEGVKLASDGTIFLANGSGGLRAYTFNGSAFSNTAYIDDGGEALDLVIARDGTIFLANDEDGLRAYTYNGSSFTNTAHIDDGGIAKAVDVGPDGTVFLANDEDGLRAYSYNGSAFSLIDHITVLDEATDVDVSPEGVVFVADYLEGMGAYSWESSTLTHLAQIDDGGPYNALMAEADGVIYMTCKYDGLRIYQFSGYVATEDISSLPTDFALEQNYPNPFNPVTTINYALPYATELELTIYDMMGHKVETLVNGYGNAGRYQVRWNAASKSSGVYIICLRADDFVDTRKMVLMK